MDRAGSAAAAAAGRRRRRASRRRLTVDDEGYVVGVRLKRGIGGRRDQVAEREVWRFRYDPARDDAGRPIRSRVEQRFMLE